MELSITDSAKSAGVTSALLLFIENIEVRKSTPDFIEICENQIKKPPNHEKFNLGIKKIIKKTTGKEKQTAGEKLRSNFEKNGFKYINNIVDSYNEASIYFGLGIGGHSLNTDKGEITIDLSYKKEKIKPLFKEKMITIDEGQIVYRLGDRIMAWIGLKDVDSDDFKITSLTNKCVFIILGHSHITYEDLKLISDRIIKNLINSSNIKPNELNYSINYVEA